MGQQRLRITFAKGAKLKYISHLDLTLAWERALRRAGVPLAYSLGFNPQAKMQLASGLPLGYTGSAEVMDIIVTLPIPLPQLVGRLRPALPEGLVLVDVKEAPLKAPSLQAALRYAVYRATVETDLPADELRSRVAQLLAAEHLEQQRIRKQRPEVFDLRPLVDYIAVETVSDGCVVLSMRLRAGQHGNLRPDAVLAALGLADACAQIERTQLLFEFDNSGSSG